MGQVHDISTTRFTASFGKMIGSKGHLTAAATVLVFHLVLAAAYPPWFDLFGGGGGYGGGFSPCNGGCNPPIPPNPCPNSGCCQNNAKQCTILLNQVPGVYDVPCQLYGGGQPYVYVSVLNDTCGPQNYEYQQQVISSNNGDFNQYAYMPYPAGSGVNVALGQHYSTSEFVQTYAFTAIGSQSRVASQTIFITFRFAACYQYTDGTTASTTAGTTSGATTAGTTSGATTAGTTSGYQTPLMLSGPDSATICPGYPPNTDPSGAAYNTYPQLTMTVVNAPPGLELIWDAAIGGYGAPNGYGVGQNFGINSPAILYGDEASVFISNMNAIAGIPNTSTNGIYGAGNNGALPCGGVSTTSTDPSTGAVTGNCCQTLLFSVRAANEVSGYSVGYKNVRVCYEDPASCVIV